MLLTATYQPTSQTVRPVRDALAGFVALALAIGVGRFAFTPILPAMQHDSGLSVAAGGALAAANYLGYLIGALAALALRSNPSTLIRAGLVLTALATLAMGFDASFAAWLAWRWIAGFASALVLVFVSAWSLERLPPARLALNGLVFSGVGAGICAAGLLCLALAHAQASANAMWIALGALSLVLTGIVWSAFAKSARTTEHTTSLPPHRPLGRGLLARFVVSYGLFGFGYIIPATFLPVMAKAALGDALLFGWVWPLFGLAAAVSTLVAAARSNASSPLRLWKTGLIVMAAGVALPAFWSGFGAVVVAALAVGGTFMIVTMAGMQAARSMTTSGAKRLMAAMTAAFATGQTIGPLTLSHAVGPAADFSSALLIAAACLIVGALLVPRPVSTARSSPDMQRKPG